MKRVYVVDDSALLRERLTELLSGFPDLQLAGQSGDPFQALRDIRLSHPDAVILDIRLPGKSGIEVLKDIKRDLPATVVIIFTNYAYPRYRKQCMNAGADHFLNKLSDFDKVAGILQEMEEASLRGIQPSRNEGEQL